MYVLIVSQLLPECFANKKLYLHNLFISEIPRSTTSETSKLLRFKVTAGVLAIFTIVVQ